MNYYEFTLKLVDCSEITSKIEDDILLAGCDDALLNSIDNSVYVDFLRESQSYNEAVNSAKTALMRAGYNTVLVEEKGQGTAVASPF